MGQFASEQCAQLFFVVLCRLVLRIRVDERPQLGAKYGCLLPDGKVLLNTAKSLNQSVVGIA